MLSMTAEPYPRGKARTTLIRRPLLLSAFFAVLSTLLLADLAPRYAPGLLRFEHYMGDVRTAFLSDQLPSQHPQVAIVAITDDTLAGYKTFLPVDRHAGYATRATERDSVVRFMAQPYPDGTAAYPKSFAALLAESAGAAPAEWRPRIAWLRRPLDGSDVFLTTAAETLLRPGDDPL